MRRKAFLLGVYATGGQVLLLRELISSLHGGELIIGTSLFGWLIWVAIGATLGGRSKRPTATTALFLVASILLPVMIAATRLIPFVVTDVVGELIPLSTAALISVIAMFPVGIFSGWLFSSIAREGSVTGDSIVTVYLWEGIGAFAAGVVTVVLAGNVLSTLETTVAIALLVIIFAPFTNERRPSSRQKFVHGIVAVGMLTVVLAFNADLAIDRFKYDSYSVEMSFDTPYSHQTILTRDSSVILLTDNVVEATSPDIQTAENLLIPPLIYMPEGECEVLLIGRAEFGVAQLVDSLPGLHITAIDPRAKLTAGLVDILPSHSGIFRVESDAARFVTRMSELNKYDIVILNVGEPGTYRVSGIITGEFMAVLKLLMKTNGVLLLPTRYDTDRYVTTETTQLLGPMVNVLRSSFDHVSIWPGASTLLLASDGDRFNMEYDSIIARIDSLPYQPRYVSDSYLFDRLDPLKIDRLWGALNDATMSNSLDRPILPHYQAYYRASPESFDRRFIALMFSGRALPYVIGGILIITLAATVWSGMRRRTFGLFVYVVAGIVSLSLELIAFYVHQAVAGSLYSEVAILIGVFMLGLSVGTYFAHRAGDFGVEIGSLVMLLVAGLWYYHTFRNIQPDVLLIYHIGFLFVTALATGGLFVAATNRYYYGRSLRNRGLGYAAELIGSAIGALTATTILLPIIGLSALLIALSVVTGVTLVCSIIIGRPG